MANVVTPPFSTSISTTYTHHFHISNPAAALCNVVYRRQSVVFCTIQHEFKLSQLCVNQSRGKAHRRILKPICAAAAGSGLETSVGDTGSTVTLKKVEIVVESRDANQMKLRVDLPAEETQKVFDVILSKLARSAPQTPGFRSQKGGKTSKIPKNLLIDILGKDRVMKFVIREIVTSAVANYVEKEKLAVKDNKLNTTQTEDELKQSFLPGSAFGFNVELELVAEETEASDELVAEETEASNTTT